MHVGNAYMHVCVCMHAGYAHMSVCMYACEACMHACVYVCMRVVRTCMYVCMCVLMCMCGKYAYSCTAYAYENAIRIRGRYTDTRALYGCVHVRGARDVDRATSPADSAATCPMTWRPLRRRGKTDRRRRRHRHRHRHRHGRSRCRNSTCLRPTDRSDLSFDILQAWEGFCAFAFRESSPIRHRHGRRRRRGAPSFRPRRHCRKS
jgi:hypothetical protein